MRRFVSSDVEDYARKFTQSESQLLQELIQETHSKTDLPEMLSGRLSGRFLKLLVQLCGAKVAVEIGTFTGYSALCIAEGLPEDGQLLCCDISEEYAAIARQYFSKSPFGHKIELKVAPALDSLKAFDGAIDFAFIDADKVSYLKYYEAILEKMSSGGLIVLDNCLWSGDVLAPHDDSSRALHKINEVIADDPRVENVILTVRDGLNLVRKK